MLQEPAEALTNRIWPGMGAPRPSTATAACSTLAPATLAALAWMVTALDADFTLTSGPPERVDALRIQADRCLHAVEGRSGRLR